jgi:hypothetical protein
VGRGSRTVLALFQARGLNNHGVFSLTAPAEPDPRRRLDPRLCVRLSFEHLAYPRSLWTWPRAAPRLGNFSAFLTIRRDKLQAPCSTFEEVPEPRPTNPLARSGYYLILALTG